jgi:arabinose-5-phosphate isomerase
MFLTLGKAVIKTEAEAVLGLLDKIDDAFARACKLMLNTTGRVVVIGMGKSGHIGSKIAATMASTGTPAFFVHPGEASHGDLGMITGDDVVLALSNSGETEEVIRILPVLKRKGVPLVALTGNARSTLARNATVHIDVSVPQEACPMGLAPTASTTAALAMGDALAIALLDARGFTPDDFALAHPGGSLGRRLLLHVDDIMHQGEDLPKVGPDVPVKAALVEMTSKRLGMTTVVDDDGCLLGVFTDGDLRRALEKDINLSETRITDAMTRQVKTVPQGTLAAEAVRIMQDNKINGLIVVDEDNKPVGALNMHDMLKAGVV